MATYRDTPATYASAGMQEAGPQESSSMEALRHQAQEAGRAMAHKVQEAGKDVAQQAQKLGEQGKDVASEYYQQGRAQVLAWQKQLEQHIREKPIQSLMIGGGIGLLLGLLWRR